MLKRINLRYRSIYQELEELVESGSFYSEPIPEAVIDNARKMAKKFLKEGHY